MDSILGDGTLQKQVEKQQEIQTQVQVQEQKQSDKLDVYREQAKRQQKSSVVNQGWVQKEWLETEEIPETAIEEQVAKHYEQARSGKKIGFFERSKAKKNVKQKFKTGVKANKAMTQFFVDGVTDYQVVEQEYKEGMKNVSDTGYYRDLKEIVPIFKTDQEKKDYMKKATSKDNADRVEALKPAIEQFCNVKEEDLAKFNVTSDEDIINNYVKYRPILQVGWCASAIIDSYKKFGGTLTKEQEWNAKSYIMTLETIKVYYEIELKRMQNPYHIMLRKEAYLDKGSKFLDKKCKEIAYNEDFLGKTDDELKEYNDWCEKYWDTKGKERDNLKAPAFHGQDILKVFRMNKADLASKFS